MHFYYYLLCIIIFLCTLFFCIIFSHSLNTHTVFFLWCFYFKFPDDRMNTTVKYIQCKWKIFIRIRVLNLFFFLLSFPVHFYLIVFSIFMQILTACTRCFCVFPFLFRITKKTSSAKYHPVKNKYVF